MVSSTLGGLFSVPDLGDTGLSAGESENRTKGKEVTLEQHLETFGFCYWILKYISPAVSSQDSNIRFRSLEGEIWVYRKTLYYFFSKKTVWTLHLVQSIMVHLHYYQQRNVCASWNHQNWIFLIMLFHKKTFSSLIKTIILHLANVWFYWFSFPSLSSIRAQHPCQPNHSLALLTVLSIIFTIAHT